MGLPRRAELLLAAVLALPLAVQAQSGGRSNTFYCCDDDSGRPVCGDTLPAICYGKAYREITPQGTIRRHVASPEELARQKAEERRREAEKARSLRQHRLDQALLETYANLEDLDTRRDRAVGDLQNSLDTLNLRLAELEAQRKRFEEEREFYRDGEAPRDLINNLRVTEAEISAQRMVIDAKTREMNAVQARFDEDRRRYLELTVDGQQRR
ncbi:hypothetical protein [Pseudothauera rhizosphaerae]|uniref:DUF4124 domain-containing protein n=1 Tax=Pseudothauera rhizosphaerae TaxID=2565932 RepID=A0A4V3WAI9_9RHOO|nr:hypothetical protein [Pseudothauera rhizosphaerae]THF59422.1 hypothetical protein E6O51_15635 [Pseudothauera rhizosphaerae]